MKNDQYILTDANSAVARIAYKTNEVCAIYPITPASKMAELTEEWSAKQRENIFGDVPCCYQMQSEAGVAATMHGALQTGSLSTTFTASQGLLLMLPNMYKIAAELTPNVIHVATRSIATHALSVFGDHSDVMAVRASGYAMLASASVQEALDFALIAQVATLTSRIPFVHFFDGFRTSHETQKIASIDDGTILEMIPRDHIDGHRQRALHPDRPVLRGTSQGPDTYFQSREAINGYYDDCAGIVQGVMDTFAHLTKRAYQLFEYYGDPNAENVVVAMASSTETIETTVDHLNMNGGKVGLIKVRLYRPFSKKHLLKALPKTCKKIAVLDRTKEPGASGEPLFLDVSQALITAFQNKELPFLPALYGGRYGLSSKEFTPAMVAAVFENLSSGTPKNNFTIGILDDTTHLSLPFARNFPMKDLGFQALFYGCKSAEFQSEFEELIRLLGERECFMQAYTEIDYKKMNSRNVHNLRVSHKAIQAPYLVQKADMVYCDAEDFLLQDNVMERIKHDAVLILKSEQSTEDFWKRLPQGIRKHVHAKSISVYLVRPEPSLLGKLMQELDPSECLTDTCLSVRWEKVDTSNTDRTPLLEEDHDFARTVLGQLLINRGNEVPVGAFPVDGTYALGTSEYVKNRNLGFLPEWDPNACTQCGVCSVVCPQSALRIKVFADDQNPGIASFRYSKGLELGESFAQLHYTIQVNPEQCTSCQLCTEACGTGALVMKKASQRISTAKKNWEQFTTIPEYDRKKIDVFRLDQQQLQEPLFKYSLGERGCGQAPYLKLVSQLFGDRMLVANATGSSSIFSGALPTTPWYTNAEGRGPAWSNSLFEDNAEFGLGFQLSHKFQREKAEKLLQALKGEINANLVAEILESDQRSEIEIQNQRNRIASLKAELGGIEGNTAKELLRLIEALVKKSVWIIGGDGWAYDIGFGGLDHVLASGENVNILVLDNEMYSNTGGQQSKATPMGAEAKFAFNGKGKQKKNLGLMAMHYEDVYVGSVAVGADPQHTLQTLVEAESYNGPSLIIAYCSSGGHSSDIKSSIKRQKAAVASGHWPLYRHDPRRQKQGLSALQLDSPKPKQGIASYFAMEERFTKLLSEPAEKLNSIQADIDKRYTDLQRLSKSEQQYAYEPLH